MTCVRHPARRGRLTFKTERRKETRKARLRNKHPAEGSGGVGSPPVGLGHLSLLAPERKVIAARSAAAPCILAGVSRRRALCEVSKTMEPDNSGQISECEEQLRLYSDDLLPSSPDEEQRVDAFDTQICQPSNGKSTDDGGGLTRLTDLTGNEKGVYVAGTRSHPRPGAPGLYTSLPFRSRQIRQIRQTARRRRREIGAFRPPGVKSVKSTPVSDGEVIV